MRSYEVMIILDAGLEEEAIRASLDRFTGLLSSRGANPGRIDRWGKRRFAYELHHRWEGYYVVVEVTSEPGPMAELDRALFLADEVIRHKVVRIPDHVVARRAGNGGSSGAAVPAGRDANGA